ncbi:unnamed protein product [Phytophthora fragariaefolia]|uniref:Unnamed protein product n=1 Tax=Phytophthora fragariaefolia TaxID=1490495 RepID=A0A9W6Y1I5_9STRA|nr:unnamed protein product [Phytophthora fragariaefolia]
MMSSRIRTPGKNLAKLKLSSPTCQPKPQVAGCLVQIWNSIFSRQGILGVESEHFSTVFALLGVLEASSQTYQSYRASNLLPRSELNSMMVTLLITNCWTTAGIGLFLRKSPALERVLALTSDAMISFVMMTIVPLVIFIPYVEAFNIKGKVFYNPDFLYNPVSLVSMVLGNRLIFAASMFDFITKVIPQLSIMLSLFTVSELLGRDDLKVVPRADSQSLQSMTVKPKASSSNSGKTAEQNKTLTVNPQNSSQRKSLDALLRRGHSIATVVFVLWGAIVLILHSLAAKRAANYEVLGCRAVTRPWFSNGKEPCASLYYDCHAQNTMSPDQKSFDKLDHVVLATLTIAHCPQLQMPPDLQKLQNLVALHIYNSTIVNWDTSSSISATAHLRLLSVLVGRTQMSEFPQGILQPLPASMIGVQFSHTNLKMVPNDLYLRWHSLVVIAFENSELTYIPYQMFFSPVYLLSFSGNQIETIPTLAMMPPGMIIGELRLTSNPLKELPAALMQPTSFIMSLNVQNTSLTDMPAWVKTNTKLVWAYDTPFCMTPMADPTLAYKVMCFANPRGQKAYFPMYMLDSLYAYNE